MDFTVSRTFSSLYILLDLAWLLVFMVTLLCFKKHLAVIVGLLAGILYFLVDYGVFYLARHAGSDRSRSVFVPAVAECKLRVHQFRLDMALIGSGWSRC